MDLVHEWYDDRYWSKILCSTIHTPHHVLKVKVTVLELLCFPMNYRDFSVKINGENNSEITIFIFTVCKKRSFYEFWLKVLPKRFKM